MAVENINIDKLNYLLTQVKPKASILLKMESEAASSFNQKYINEETGEKVYFKYWKDKELTKKNTITGELNFSYNEEMSQKLGTTYEAKRSIGEKVGALVLSPNGTKLPLMNPQYSSPEYFYKGVKLSALEIENELNPFKKKSSINNNGISMIAPFVRNIKSIIIDSTEYRISITENPA